jgi:Ca2+-binding RTX toxin-like protein
MGGRRLAVGACVAAVSLAVPAGAAAHTQSGASPSSASCGWDTATHALTVDFSGQGVISTQKSGLILVDGVDCFGGATTANVDSIAITSDGSDVQIYEIDHALAPGLTPEPTGVSEIEATLQDVHGVEVDLANSQLQVSAGDAGINVDGDDDADITGDAVLTSVTLSAAKTRVPVTITGQGGAGTGGPWTSGLGIIGGKGADTLTGGNGTNAISGTKGNDTIVGGPGPDDLHGGPGDDVVDGLGGVDTVAGDAGNDTLTGGAGQDLIIGGTGNDTLFAQDGEADRVEGGGGTDTAQVDAGLDIVKGVP